LLTQVVNLQWTLLTLLTMTRSMAKPTFYITFSQFKTP
jgi:hypothetical protein